jgi:hypothetical protein
MNEPNRHAAYVEGMDPLAEAEYEIAYEHYCRKVEEAKKRLLTKKPWYVKLFPFRINLKIERI